MAEAGYQVEMDRSRWQILRTRQWRDILRVGRCAHGKACPDRLSGISAIGNQKEGAAGAAEVEEDPEEDQEGDREEDEGNPFLDRRNSSVLRYEWICAYERVSREGCLVVDRDQVWAVGQSPLTVQQKQVLTPSQ